MTIRRALIAAALTIAAGIAAYTTTAQTPGETQPPSTAPTAAMPHPNIVYILCDDLGYGDVHALNPQRGKIKTPNIDKLVTQGMTFSDAHSGDAVCTPSRYGILTGRYAWRTHLQAGVLNGMTSEPLIAPTRLTVPEMLKKQGYATAMIGKWHLGMQWGANQFADAIKDDPIQHGFDYYFGISASLDMPPFVYIENNKFTEIPTTTKKWLRTGPAAADFDAMNVLPDFTKKAVGYIKDHAADAKNGKPFFLYLALSSPHTPIVPTPKWQGKSGLGPYGDFVMETDWATGEVMKAIDDAGITDNTLLVFTSDNGCSPAADVKHLESEGHYPSADRRGYKADIWDGGHRIPLVVRWPGKVAAGSETTEITSLIDLMATTADFLGVKVPPNAGEDSVSMLPALLQKEHTPLREAVVYHSIDGCFAIQKGKWKLELCAGSGGWAAPREWAAKQQGLPPVQLYDMNEDVGEQKNVATEHPDVVKELNALLEEYVKDGRSTPGPEEKNDAKINLHKEPKPPKPATATQPRDD
jgi:arylsulfatase A